MSKRQRIINLIYIREIINNNDYLLSDKTIDSIMEHLDIDVKKVHGQNKS